jgi:transcriptional regulator with XRE-family HTH domain
MEIKVTIDEMIELFQDKEFRDSFLGEWIAFTLRSQIKAMRLRKGWTQAELARKMKTGCSAVSRLENMTPKTLPSISTLQKVAQIFDVGLIVRFSEWSSLIKEIGEYLENGHKIPIPNEFKDDVLFGENAAIRK